MKDKKPDFIVIPKKVLYCKEILPNAKLLFGEIAFLCSKNKEGCCWASNNYFAEIFEVSETSISLWISSLLSNKFIKKELKHKSNTRKIYLNTSLSTLKHILRGEGSLSKLKGILKEPQPLKAVAPDTNLDDFNIETKQWTDSKGQTHIEDSIDYEEES